MGKGRVISKSYTYTDVWGTVIAIIVRPEIMGEGNAMERILNTLDIRYRYLHGRAWKPEE